LKGFLAQDLFDGGFDRRISKIQGPQLIPPGRDAFKVGCGLVLTSLTHQVQSLAITLIQLD